MKGLFGRKKKRKVLSAAQQRDLRAKEAQDQLNSLRQEIQDHTDRQEHVNTEIKQIMRKIKAEKQKRRPDTRYLGHQLKLLKQKKKKINNYSNYILSAESRAAAIEDAIVLNDVLAREKSAAAYLQKNRMDIEEVEDLQDQIQEITDDNEEINNLVGNSVGTDDLDDEDIMAQVDDIVADLDFEEGEEIDAELPVPRKIVDPVALPAAPNTSLPAVAASTAAAKATATTDEATDEAKAALVAAFF